MCLTIHSFKFDCTWRNAWCALDIYISLFVLFKKDRRCQDVIVIYNSKSIYKTKVWLNNIKQRDKQTTELHTSPGWSVFTFSEIRDCLFSCYWLLFVDHHCLQFLFILVIVNNDIQLDFQRHIFALSVFVFSELILEVVLCFVDVGAIVDHHCLNFLFIFCGQWVNIRGGSLFCWCWCNCWPSLFKLSFHILWSVS